MLRKKIKSFTIIELMISLTILALLYAFAIGPSSQWVAKKDYDTKTLNSFENINKSFETYFKIYTRDSLFYTDFDKYNIYSKENFDFYENNISFYYPLNNINENERIFDFFEKENFGDYTIGDPDLFPFKDNQINSVLLNDPKWVTDWEGYKKDWEDISNIFRDYGINTNFTGKDKFGQPILFYIKRMPFIIPLKDTPNASIVINKDNNAVDNFTINKLGSYNNFVNYYSFKVFLLSAGYDQMFGTKDDVRKIYSYDNYLTNEVSKIEQNIEDLKSELRTFFHTSYKMDTSASIIKEKTNYFITPSNTLSTVPSGFSYYQNNFSDGYNPKNLIQFNSSIGITDNSKEKFYFVDITDDSQTIENMEGNFTKAISLNDRTIIDNYFKNNHKNNIIKTIFDSYEINHFNNFYSITVNPIFIHLFDYKDKKDFVRYPFIIKGNEITPYLQVYYPISMANSNFESDGKRKDCENLTGNKLCKTVFYKVISVIGKK